MNDDISGYKDEFLNDVNITSNIRAPGEYKYFYSGENSTETDKSFLFFSTMWFTEKVTENMEIISSCYNSINTAQLFFNKKTNLYNLFIYKNKIDYRNENMSLKLFKIINIALQNKTDNQNNANNNRMNNNTKFDKDFLNNINTKIYFASNNYILLNELDNRILLIDIDNNSYITIFSKIYEEKEVLYNIFDTYDETFLINGQQKIRTYAFLSMKYQDRKTPTYKYSYFTIQKSVDKIIHLYPINLDLGNSEPLSLKIAKIIHKDKEGEQKCFFIFSFLSTTISLQLITDYDNLTLHQMFQKYCKINGEREEDLDNENNNNEIQIKKLKFWIGKSNIKTEKIQFSQGMKLYLNINSKKISSLIYYIESKGIISYNFNYFDTPEEISKKIFISQKELNINNGLDYMKRIDPKIKTYNFLDCYQFKSKCFFGFSDKNLVLGEKNVIHIYEENSSFPAYTYEFFQENLSSLITIDGIGCTFILTGKKLFKIIYNPRYKLFSDKMLFSKNIIHYYKYNYNVRKNNPNQNNNENNDKPIFPLFEYKPEDIWNGYCNNLNIPPLIFPENIYYKIGEDKEEEVEYPKKDEKFKMETNLFSKNCILCHRNSELLCSQCGSRYYCCYEHFKYDYYSFHFFECQIIQFFKRKDFMKISNLEIRYKILYNELIKLCGRILNFIFTRIYSKYDYVYFLNMILTLIKIFYNFGFQTNLSDFCWLNFNLANDKRKNRNERNIFYLEALFYYVQLNFLKCTFTLKGGLYNLTDCYIKIIKNDIIPKLTPKANKRLISLKLEKIKKKIIYNNEYFSEFNYPLFFDIKKFLKYLGSNKYIDLIEEYIVKHLYSLSLLAKFKIKIHSNIEVQNTFVDINLMFDDHYSENQVYKNIVPYCYFSTSFYLVEIGKITQTIKLLRRMVGFNFDLSLNNKLRALIYFNLGLLQYSLGSFDIGIHNIETSYKLIDINNFSEKIKFHIIDSLGLAYLNQKNLFKAYILIQTSVKERKKLNKQKYQNKCNRLNVYLNYIVDLYEYNFISKTRFLIKSQNINYDKHKLIKFVLGDEDKELVISEQNLNQFIKVVEFIWKLSDSVLKQLNLDNPPKAPTLNREEAHHERNLSFNSDVSQISSTFIYKDNGNEKDEMLEEYEEDIEVKTHLYDTLLTRQQQQEFKELKTIYLKRDIILRDSLGSIEKFNINFDPIYADEFQKIIEKLKINFLLKEIFYCFQNEKWRDELYNYNQNNILFGLSKYLKLEKIQNMMAIERSKNIEMKKKEKMENKINNYGCDYSSIEEEEISDKETGKNKEDEWLKTKERDEEEESISNKNISEKKDIPKSNKNMSYKKFKKKFIGILKELEKENKNDDIFEFINLDEDYLYTLYKNVYINNPDRNFIFQNPLLILNYIYLELNKPDSSVPIIGANNKIIRSVMTRVKEEDESSSFNSVNNLNKEKNKNEILTTQKEILNLKRIKSSSSSNSSSSLGSNSSSINRENLKEERSCITNFDKERKRSSSTRVNLLKKKEDKEIIQKRKNKKNNTIEFRERKDYRDLDNIRKTRKKTKKLLFNFDVDKKFNEYLEKKKNTIKKNNSYSYDSSTEIDKNKINSTNFIIVSQETTFCFIPIKKVPTFIATFLKKETTKSDKKLRRKTQIIFPKKKYNLLKDFSRKNSISIVKNKIRDKTFVEEVDMLNFSKAKNVEEEEENKKNFTIIQKQNRINPYIKQGSFTERESNINNNDFSRKNSGNKNSELLKLTKRDILLGNYKNSKSNIGDKTFRERKSKISNRLIKNSFNLAKELKDDKTESSKISIKKNKINKNISESNEKSYNEELSKDYFQYKNNSLIKHFMQNSNQQKKKPFIDNKHNKEKQIINYSHFLNINQKSKPRNKESSLISQKKTNYQSKDYGFKSKKERDKKIENEALEYLKVELNNKNNLNKNRLINSSGIKIEDYNNYLSKFTKINQNKKEIKKNEKIKNYNSKKKKEKEKDDSYLEIMNNKFKEKDRNNVRKKILIEEKKKNNIYDLFKNEINKKFKNNIRDESKNNNINDIGSYTSRINNKIGNEESIYNKYMIFENSSYINNINSNSKFISLNNSNINKKRINKSIEMSNDKNINSDTKRIFQMKKLYPFLNNNYLIRKKDSSGMNTMSNTNAHTPRTKRKLEEKKRKISVNSNNKI